MATIKQKEFKKMIKGANNVKLHELIISGINEDINLSDAQLLKLVKLEQGAK